MRNNSLLAALLALSLASVSLQVVVAKAATPSNPDQARIEQLQQQVDALNQELSRIRSAPDPQAQQQAMHQHWSMMQDHMRSLRDMPGMGARGCTDWMMMDPGMMGSGTMGSGMMGPGMMGPGMAGGCPMMGHGMGSGGMWGMPSHMTPSQYQSQMQGHMQQMQHRMHAIALETDPTKREALLREHYQGMYRDMQTMRGMGWMWTPKATASLPDRDSQGAKLVAAICSQCHLPPSPSLHTATEWADVTARMRQHMQQQANAAGSGVTIPSAAELDEISRYLAEHGAEPQSSR